MVDSDPSRLSHDNCEKVSRISSKREKWRIYKAFMCFFTDLHNATCSMSWSSEEVPISKLQKSIACRSSTLYSASASFIRAGTRFVSPSMSALVEMFMRLRTRNIFTMVVKSTVFVSSKSRWMLTILAGFLVLQANQQRIQTGGSNSPCVNVELRL